MLEARKPLWFNMTRRSRLPVLGRQSIRGRCGPLGPDCSTIYGIFSQRPSSVDLRRSNDGLPSFVDDPSTLRHHPIVSVRPFAAGHR